MRHLDRACRNSLSLLHKVWDLSCEVFKAGGDSTAADCNHLEAPLLTGLGQDQSKTRAAPEQPCASPRAVASSQHGSLRVTKLLTCHPRASMSILESSMAFYDQPVEVPLQSMDQSSHSPTQIQRKESDSLLDMGAGGRGGKVTLWKNMCDGKYCRLCKTPAATTSW